MYEAQCAGGPPPTRHYYCEHPPTSVESIPGVVSPVNETQGAGCLLHSTRDGLLLVQRKSDVLLKQYDQPARDGQVGSVRPGRAYAAATTIHKAAMFASLPLCPSISVAPLPLCLALRCYHCYQTLLQPPLPFAYWSCSPPPPTSPPPSSPLTLLPLCLAVRCHHCHQPLLQPPLPARRLLDLLASSPYLSSSLLSPHTSAALSCCTPPPLPPGAVAALPPGQAAVRIVPPPGSHAQCPGRRSAGREAWGEEA